MENTNVNNNQNLNEGKEEKKMNYNAMKKSELIEVIMRLESENAQKEASLVKAREVYTTHVDKIKKLQSRVKELEVKQPAPDATPSASLNIHRGKYMNGKLVCEICGSGISHNVKDYLDRNPATVPAGYDYLCVPCQRDPQGRLKTAEAKKIAVQTDVNKVPAIETPAAQMSDIITDDSIAAGQAMLRALLQQSGSADTNNNKGNLSF
ncbi:MAG TPA: hypothetical protein VK190_03380 [Pseudoneobacillus sp.]|jgi:hypothetical protein|nr:hypothetical protein [Pseudoneobacillus sp.]